MLIKVAKRNYGNFAVATSMVSARTRPRRYTAAEQADLDVRTSVNKIGEIINLAQELNTIIWTVLNNGGSLEDIHELYMDVSKLNVLSNVEIDRAKREFSIDSHKEIEKIKAKHLKRAKDGRMIKPAFFGTIAKTKGYYDPKRKTYKSHATTMDYVQKEVCAHVRMNETRNFLQFSSLIKPMTYSKEAVNKEQYKRVIELVRNTKQEIRRIWSDDTLSKSDRYMVYAGLRQECIDRISAERFNSHTMYKLLRSIEYPDNSDICQAIFDYLFGIPNESFFEIIAQSSTPIGILEEDADGEITLYGYRFRQNAKVLGGSIEIA